MTTNPKIANRRAAAGHTGNRGHSWKFTTLLGCLLFAVVMRPFVLNHFLGRLIFVAAMTVLFGQAIWSLCKERWQRWLAISLGVACIAFRWTELVLPARSSIGVGLVGRGIEIVFFSLTVVMLVAAIFRNQAVTLDNIFGAFAGYLLIAVVCGLAFSAVELARPGSFHVQASLTEEWKSPEHRDWLLHYFSCCTLTTVGYGDVTPVRPIARTLAVLEMMIGQLYLAVLVAVLVGVKVAQTTKND